MPSLHDLLAGFNGKPWDIGLAVISWLSSIIAFFAYFPGTIRIMRNRQTFFLSTAMWSLTMTGLLSLTIVGGCLGGQAQAAGWGSGAIASGYSMVVFDGINFILCGVILAYKIYNQHLAKLQNTTEQKICEAFMIKLEKRDVTK